jgi:hypothetical protein
LCISYTILRAATSGIRQIQRLSDPVLSHAIIVLLGLSLNSKSLTTDHQSTNCTLNYSFALTSSYSLSCISGPNPFFFAGLWIQITAKLSTSACLFTGMTAPMFLGVHVANSRQVIRQPKPPRSNGSMPSLKASLRESTNPRRKGQSR